MCRKGEEVTISYGNWPNDVFLLFFGFVPDSNQHDAVVLFPSLHELVSCYQAIVQQQREQVLSQQQQPQNNSKDPYQQQQQQQESQRNQTNQHSGSHPNDIELHTRQQAAQTSVLTDQSDEKQESGSQSSELSSEAIAAALPQQGAAESCTDSLVPELQDRLGPGDWSR